MLALFAKQHIVLLDLHRRRLAALSHMAISRCVMGANASFASDNAYDLVVYISLLVRVNNDSLSNTHYYTSYSLSQYHGYNYKVRFVSKCLGTSAALGMTLNFVERVFA